MEQVLSSTCLHFKTNTSPEKNIDFQEHSMATISLWYSAPREETKNHFFV